MDSSRKETIINEIQYWKQHQLLPEHYCDFLLALYTEGQSPERKSKKRLVGFLFIFLIVTALCLSVFVIYFTELNFVLQTMILTSFVVLLLFLGIYYFKKRYWYTIFYIGTAIQMLLLSVFVNDKWMHNDPISLCITIALNCLLWIIAGWRLKLYYFILSGFIGIVVLVIYMVI